MVTSLWHRENVARLAEDTAALTVRVRELESIAREQWEIIAQLHESACKINAANLSLAAQVRSLDREAVELADRQLEAEINYLNLTSKKTGSRAPKWIRRTRGYLSQGYLNITNYLRRTP